MGSNPSSFKECGENCPVESVSWNDAQEFIKRLCLRENYSPCKYRLPTEAEWEYAARAGTKTKYYWGDTINDAYLWYNNNSGGTTNPVGKKKPNAWGLYDMSGNVWEWVEDWYDEVYYIKSPDINGPSSGKIRVLRGGSWNFKAGDGRLSYRGGSDPDSGEDYDGFRLVFLP
jgi:formylglycine-generating enzyme required for sulfatase activity